MSEAERWLKDWHAAHPGATSRAIARGQPSSYERLADRATTGDRVLDLACGDGWLLELLLARSAREVTGVDMSPDELAAARTRLGHRAHLVEGQARALPFSDESFDLVTCHLALMLMDAPDAVVAEVRRVLRPGGMFAAVVGGGPKADDAWGRVVQIAGSTPHTGPSIGDPRAHHEAGLRELLETFHDVRVEPLDVDLSGPEEEVWSLLASTYLFEMVPREAMASFEAAVRAALRELRQPDGTVPCAMQFQMVSGRR